MPKSKTDHFMGELLETSARRLWPEGPPISADMVVRRTEAVANCIAIQTGGHYLRVTPETYAKGLEEMLRPLHFRYEWDSGPKPRTAGVVSSV